MSESRFPKSSFSMEVLEENAGKFDIPRMFKYVDRCPAIRNPAILTEDERKYVEQGIVRHRMDTIEELYTKKLTPFDAYFLVPRWPITVVMQTLELNKEMASVLKRLCNTMRDISPEEYNRRVLAKVQDDVINVTKNNRIKFNGDGKVTVEQLISCTTIELKPDYSHYNDIIARCKKYLTAKTIGKMPPDLGKEFVKVPEFLVKRAWQGPQFNTCYKKAVARFKG